MNSWQVWKRVLTEWKMRMCTEVSFNKYFVLRRIIYETAIYDWDYGLWLRLQLMVAYFHRKRSDYNTSLKVS